MLVESWDGYLAAVAELERGIGPNMSLPASLVYRGQPSSKFELATTLERKGRMNLPALQYFRMMVRAIHEAEAFSGLRWTLPSRDEYLEWATSGTPMPGSFPAYDFAVYLRHHGFPSPLLDWSVSPYVAAFFAFSNASASEEAVSVFAFHEYVGVGKSFSGSQPTILSLGPLVRAPKRHFLQQSRYTVCTLNQPSSAEGLCFAPHQSVFNQGRDDQDALYRFDIPGSERRSALKYLDRFNLNAASLFASEDGLMHTLGFRVAEAD